ncbi:MAG: hypothetical protein ABEI52_00075 [Halobacteriaceae archaeon]
MSTTTDSDAEKDAEQEQTRIKERLDSLEESVNRLQNMNDNFFQDILQLYEGNDEHADRLDEVEKRLDRIGRHLDDLDQRVGRTTVEQVVKIRSWTDEEIQLLKELSRIKHGSSDKTQRELADEFDMTEAAVSQWKQKFEKYDLL